MRAPTVSDTYSSFYNIQIINIIQTITDVYVKRYWLTIGDLIAVISLCATFYSLGYARGKHDSEIKK